MKIPKSVNVGGHKISVVFGGVDSSSYGLYQCGTSRINIQQGLLPGVSEETFFHEIIEAINDLYELHLPHRTIQTLGVALHQALGPHMK